MPKPIEPGCRAIIVNAKTSPENNGKVVKVIRKMAKDELFINTAGRRGLVTGAFAWLVISEGTPLLVRWNGKKFYTPDRPYAEQCLRRLDDFEPADHLWNIMEVQL
jgi:hypothetical protein